MSFALGLLTCVVIGIAWLRWSQMTRGGWF